MPLLTVNLVAGRTSAELDTLLEVAHSVVLDAFDAPERDLYQIVREHDSDHFRMLDTGLDIARTPAMVLVEVTSRPRTRDQKQAFYRLLCERLQERCGIAASDVMVTITENTDEDWSCGRGRAQFRTGER